jgi:hypothetical protein
VKKELMLNERKKLLLIMEKNYRNASKSDKGILLSTYTVILGYCRKYLSHLLNQPKMQVKLSGSGCILQADPRKKSKPKDRKKIYTEDTIRVIVFLWRTYDHVNSKRLHAMFQKQMEKMEQFYQLHKREWELQNILLSEKVKQQLMKISISTIERILAKERKRWHIKGCPHTKPGSLQKTQIPIRTYAMWNENMPGFTELDLVGHEGGDNRGEFCFSLDVTDVCTGWTETRAIRNKAQVHVFAALREIQGRLPFQLKGIDSDNGSEFINGEMVRFCTEERITFTRGRVNYKNDQCYVEQKNWTHVRKYVGYARYDCEGERIALNELYEALRFFTNYFLPGVKLQEKLRIGAQVKKRYDTPRTPYERLLESPHIPVAVKEKLQQTYQALDPFELKKKITYLQHRLQEVRRKKEVDHLAFEDKLPAKGLWKDVVREEMKQNLYPDI